MLPVIAVFVVWLALTGRLSFYGELMRTGPGINLTSIASKAVGGTGTPNVGSNNPVINPGHVSPPPGQGPLDWFWNKIGLGPPPTNGTIKN